jgi:hypothetical protein
MLILCLDPAIHNIFSIFILKDVLLIILKSSLRHDFQEPR